MKRSEQQQNVVNFATVDTGHLILRARAGCGKTTTILDVVQTLVKDGLTGPGGIFIGAYNRKIADEIIDKLADLGITWNKATANTMHGIGKRAWAKIAPKACENITDKKLGMLFDQIWPGPVENQKASPERAYREFVLQAVSLAKQRAFGVLASIDDRKAWYDLVDHFGLEESLEDADNPANNLSEEKGIEMSIRLYRRSLDTCREIVDFDDIILAPLYFKIRCWQFSWVFVDEAQDTNPARRALALKILRPGGRLIAVGDDCQAIYGFTGADADSLDLIKNELNASELPLSVTYRCAKSIVRLANTWVPDLTAHETAPEGVVRTIHEKDLAFEDFQRTDAILCRNTAPLVELAYALLRRGTGCRVEGKKIGEGLLKLANRWSKIKTLDALENKLDAFEAYETQKWLAKGQEQKAADVEDNVATVRVLIQTAKSKGFHNISDLDGIVKAMFGDTKEGEVAKVLTLSTVHKSKGREWDRVYLLGRNKFMPSKYARKEWQQVQEDNLCYVAVTRAKNELVEVFVPVKRESAE